MPVTLNGTNGLVFNDGSSQATAAKVGMVNRIINGDMRIDQRNNGASVSVSSVATYVVDRWQVQFSNSATVSSQRSTSAPAGFVNSWQQTVTTPKTPATSDYAVLTQVVEGFNFEDLGWGTANAQTVTISFWARSSVAGTYSIFLRNAFDFSHSYVATYSISAANTWEYKTITIPGATVGVWSTGNAGSLQLGWELGSGSNFTTTSNTWVAGSFFRTSGTTNWVNTTGATFYITGVQLERGSVATEFERVEYGEMLRRCQRYYERSADTNGVFTLMTRSDTNTSTCGNFSFAVEKRANPTVQVTNGSFSSPTGLLTFLQAGYPTLTPASLSANTRQITEIRLSSVSSTAIAGGWVATSEL